MSMTDVISQIESDDRNTNLTEFPYRVIHFKNNPHQLAIHAQNAEIEKLKRENERLKARLDILQSGSTADITRAINTALNSSSQLEKLSKRLSMAEKREENLLSSFRKRSLQFREACYLLTGWRIDALKDGIFRLSNMYAGNENDKLLFEIQPDGTIQLLENEYINQLSYYITKYLEDGDSIPAFLASITLDLFKSSTQLGSETMSMSMTMSETIRPSNEDTFAN